MQNRKQKKNSEKARNVVRNDNIVIDQETLTDAIVKAYQIIEEKKREQEIELEKKRKNEWRNIIGQKEYPLNEKWYLHRYHVCRNNLVKIWKLLFFKAENAKELRATFGLMQLAVMGIFSICKWCLYLIACALIYYTFQNKDNVFNLLIAILTWIFGRIFRIASLEVENIKDVNLLIAIFSGSISFVAVIVAIIAIFVN